MNGKRSFFKSMAMVAVVLGAAVLTGGCATGSQPPVGSVLRQAANPVDDRVAQGKADPSPKRTKIGQGRKRR